MSIKNPMHPGEFLLEAFMKPFGITCAEMAMNLGVSPSTISRITNKKMDLTAGMAMRLSIVVGRTPESWMNMQNNYSLRQFIDNDKSELAALKPMKFEAESDNEGE